MIARPKRPPPEPRPAPPPPDIARLFVEHAQRVAEWAGWLGGPAFDEVAREEIVQEVFLTVQRLLPGFRGEAGITTWLYRITANEVRHRRRRDRWRRWLAGSSEEVAGSLPSPRLTPVEELERRQSAELVYRVLDSRRRARPHRADPLRAGGAVGAGGGGSDGGARLDGVGVAASGAGALRARAARPRRRAARRTGRGPMSAGDPRVPAAAASPVVTRLRDGGGGACDAHTASLFASVQRPTPLASETLARIQDGLDRATRAGAARAPRNHRMVAAAAAFLVGAVCAGALHNVLARRDQAIPAGLRVVVLGSGSASSDAGGTVRVEHGRVAVRTGDRGVQVRASSARIEVHAASVVEIDSAEEARGLLRGFGRRRVERRPAHHAQRRLLHGPARARRLRPARRDEVMRAVGSDTGELPAGQAGTGVGSG